MAAWSSEQSGKVDDDCENVVAGVVAHADTKARMAPQRMKRRSLYLHRRRFQRIPAEARDSAPEEASSMPGKRPTPRGGNTYIEEMKIRAHIPEIKGPGQLYSLI